MEAPKGLSGVVWPYHNVTRHDTPDHTAQHNTAQHSTAQHSTAQHSTAQQRTTQQDAKNGTCTVVFTQQQQQTATQLKSAFGLVKQSCRCGEGLSTFDWSRKGQMVSGQMKSKRGTGLSLLTANALPQQSIPTSAPQCVVTRLATLLL